ncbi:adapter protein MecA 1/2 [Planifilum fimeticola]|jgi:adapter protein MecA 1/2|uniref:Adapter protein MecA 1/2 n=1 Tax=Planifilum fimeticola TaxID=201975 RepID=A0A2T0LD58_9BACL|nr:genetic competence negative regulator [Planifilum fimeticola]PRX39994.1 adapter protein MecA 1/2 [Planifilum fimeticola]
MRVERLGRDKIRFYLSLDDLVERGIEKEDMWRDIPKVHELFNDMMEQAYRELGFEIAGPVAVEVFTLPAQGMVVIVTRGRPSHSGEFDDDDMYELEVTLEESDQIIFRFVDFEDLVQAAMRMHPLVERDEGKVYAHQGQYYLVFDEDVKTKNLDALVAILSEYGEASTVTEHVLVEYGTTVWAKDAVHELVRHFSR